MRLACSAVVVRVPGTPHAVAEQAVSLILAQSKIHRLQPGAGGHLRSRDSSIRSRKDLWHRRTGKIGAAVARIPRGFVPPVGVRPDAERELSTELNRPGRITSAVLRVGHAARALTPATIIWSMMKRWPG
jgi:hypothetical protein